MYPSFNRYESVVSIDMGQQNKLEESLVVVVYNARVRRFHDGNMLVIQSTQGIGHTPSLLEPASSGHLVLIHPGQWHHLVFQFIAQGLADLQHNHTNSAIPTPEVL